MFSSLLYVVVSLKEMESPEKDNKLPLQIYKYSYVSQVYNWSTIGIFETTLYMLPMHRGS
jgi:hypothetical protein